MTVSQPEAQERQVSENVAVLMHRSGMKQVQLATAVGINQATLSRRMAGSLPWMLWEVQALADFFAVSLSELTTGLPSLMEWQARWDLRARRDSNPKPSDLESRPRMTVLAGGLLGGDSTTPAGLLEAV